MGHFGGEIVDSNRGTYCRGCHLGSSSGFSDGAGAGFRLLKRALKIFLSLPRNANEGRWGSSVTYLRTHPTPRYLDMALNESPPTFTHYNSKSKCLNLDRCEGTAHAGCHRSPTFVFRHFTLTLQLYLYL